MKKVLLLLFITVVLIIIFVGKNFVSKNSDRILRVDDRTIYLEVADSDKERTQGLSGRASLDKTRGLLFVFTNSQIYNFWMKDMNFPLDFLWLNEKKVIDLTENVPAPIDKDLTNLTLYQPSEPVNEVIELNAGMVKELGIKIGDTLKY